MTQKVMNCPHCGKILPKEFWHKKKQMENIVVKCPKCWCNKVWKDSKR